MLALRLVGRQKGQARASSGKPCNNVAVAVDAIIVIYSHIVMQSSFDDIAVFACVAVVDSVVAAVGLVVDA